mgnify:CR=1 FL=1
MSMMNKCIEELKLEGYINIPNELSNVMSDFNYPLSHIEIHITCVKQEEAEKLVKGLEKDVVEGFKLAIKNGWGTTNRKVKNPKINGRCVSFEYFDSIVFLRHRTATPSLLYPFVEYNQYKPSLVESLTYKIRLHENAKNAFSVYKSYLSKCFQEKILDDFTIEEDLLVLTCNGVDHFARITQACCGAEKVWKENNQLKQQNNNVGCSVIPFIVLISSALLLWGV